MLAFNLNALKAHLGGLLGTAGLPIGTFVIHTFEAGCTCDVPASFEGVIITGINYAVAFLAVWLTPNIKVAS